MCYSAQVYADWKKFTRMFGARMSVEEFYKTIWTRNDELERRQRGRVAPRIKPAKCAQQHHHPEGAGASVRASDESDRERDIKALIDAHTAHRGYGDRAEAVCPANAIGGSRARHCRARGRRPQGYEATAQ